MCSVSKFINGELSATSHDVIKFHIYALDPCSGANILLDKIEKKNREFVAQHERFHVHAEVTHSIRPSLMMKFRCLLSGVFVRIFRRKLKFLPLDDSNNDESSSNYILNLTVWALVIIFALLFGAFQIFLILVYIHEY
jgi:hypothetical protein